MKYWRAVCRYGHVGRQREVSVARFLVTDAASNIMDVYSLVKDMPGIKARGIIHLKIINREAYEQGKKQEETNLYLRKLKTYRATEREETFCAQ